MTHKLLLADDSVTIQKVVELTFSEEDFTIITVGDGTTALERIKAERPDIILSDVIMPGLNGYDLCSRVKGDAGLRQIPFLFLKGTFESFDEAKALSLGADGYIVKPFESQELIARVKEMIRKAAEAAPPPVAPPVAVAPEPSPFAEPSFADLTFGESAPAAPPPPAMMEPIFETAALPVPTPFETSFGEILPEPPPPPPPETSEEDMWSEVSIAHHPIPGQAGPATTEAGRAMEGELSFEIPSPEPEPEPEPLPLEPAYTFAQEAPAVPPEPVPEAIPEGESAPEFFETPFEPVPVETPEPPPHEVAPPLPVPPPAMAAPLALDEEEIRAALAARVEEVLRQVLPTVVREVLERVITDVVWEVVPDTAEKLISREIARITGETPIRS
jgi:CheY-like chemotaxis protein